MRLHHVSDVPSIDYFVPRADAHGTPVVWAIDETHLPNYLLPRDCPRVCVRRGACEDAALIARLLGAESHTIYVEHAWRERIATTTLYVYEFEAAQFVCVDKNAGYFQSTLTMTPRDMKTIVDPTRELRARGVALRYVDSLWPIQDAVTGSSLEFSCIRMRNARAAYEKDDTRT